MGPFWDLLYEHGAEFVYSGDDHNYQRFAPQTPAGVLDPQTGIREFVVGTGGALLYDLGTSPIANLEVANDETFGVLRLTLHSSSYDWQFIPVPGKGFTDAGSQQCH